MNDKSGFQACELASRYYEGHVERFNPRFVGSPVAAWVTSGDIVFDVARGPGIATGATSVAIGPTRRAVSNDLNPSEIRKRT
jgi:hypothetical protein